MPHFSPARFLASRLPPARGLLRGLLRSHGRSPPPKNRTMILSGNSLLDPPVNRLVQEPCLTSLVICAVHAPVTSWVRGALIYPLRSLVRAPGHSWGQ